jgi:hypothetical protein
MSLYHRTNNRTSLALEVQLQFKGKNLGRACTRNINPFGVFIEFPEPELVTDDFVGISFTSKNEDKACALQKGMVMHASKEGIGILFASYNEEFRTMLEQEISQAGSSEINI